MLIIELVVFFRHCVSDAIMADAFSSSSETVIQRVVDVTVKTNTPPEKLEELYQIKETCDFISQHQFKKVRTSFYLFVNYVNISLFHKCLRTTPIISLNWLSLTGCFAVS